MSHRNIPRRQRGLTLIELLLVLVVVLAIAVTGFILFGQTSAGQKAQDGQTALMAVSTSVKRVVNGRNFTGVSSAVLVQADVVPENLVVGSTIVNPWGGLITVAPAGIASGANNSYSIQFEGVPREACNQMIANTHPQFYRVQVGSSVLINRDASDTTATAADIATACDAQLNTVTWTAIG
jgi:prepilin-type N-terminal cleavage/methylation domain-containing protein